MNQVTPFVERVRESLRTQLLDAAADLLADRGFRGLRMADVAAATGVSRQTVHNEFGTKEALVNAVAAHTVADFLEGVAQRFTDADDVHSGIAAAVRHTLTHATENRLVNAILTGTDAEDLLPLLTTKGRPVLMPAVDLLTELWRPRMPWLPDREIRLLAEAGMRLTVSHLLTPTGTVDEAVATITALMRRLIPEAPDD
ncbi:TetR/AcrR family transcriptional regulator [Kutzneria kofuensis]|uniref:AcrR family transcriptional regulator n=1 Tax=Kutzneria kofuensis TaxID=103725 RepID=A0A7W9NG28_9PSEU|nr:TetR family transcriptional regulator [Kutzneria kofuensis]MBB5892102.1 AcrR family transcriptional regulator [Kutzneria kofuensis]